ncbi:Chromatin structure-remodeling complex protein rsc9 [Tieghemiomyces parasiticus]|uniref:Chromatin structure-remodeling complex protein rsc9 n=1 Tax=Tieghemiomyces parasiticus TaxID=78921 RepID=A0A9W8ABX3_9FUNG|nr:Chromatin structure-remodeling complex protein rsc9 [Tieghemiomyces parasiticus]
MATSLAGLSALAILPTEAHMLSTPVGLFNHEFFTYHQAQGVTAPQIIAVGRREITPLQFFEHLRAIGFPKTKAAGGSHARQILRRLGISQSSRNVHIFRAFFDTFMRPFVIALNREYAECIQSPTTQQRAEEIKTLLQPPEARRERLVDILANFRHGDSSPAITPESTQPASERSDESEEEEEEEEARDGETSATETRAKTVTKDAAGPPTKRLRPTLEPTPFNPLAQDLEEYLGGQFRNRIFLALRSNLPNEVDWAFNRLLRVSKFCNEDFDIQCIPGILPAILYHLKLAVIRLVNSYALSRARSATTADTDGPLEVPATRLFNQFECTNLARILQIMTVLGNLAQLESPTAPMVLSEPTLQTFNTWILRGRAIHSGLADRSAIVPIAQAAEVALKASDLIAVCASVPRMDDHWARLMRSSLYFYTTELHQLCLEQVESTCLVAPVAQILPAVPQTLRMTLFSPDRATVVRTLRGLAYLLLREHPQLEFILDASVLNQLTNLLLAPDMELMQMTMDVLIKLTECCPTEFMARLAGTSGVSPGEGNESASEIPASNVFSAPSLIAIVVFRIREQARPTLGRTREDPRMTHGARDAAHAAAANDPLYRWLLANLELAAPALNPAGPDKPLVPSFTPLSILYEAYTEALRERMVTGKSTDPPLSVDAFVTRVKNAFPNSHTVQHPKTSQLICLHLRRKLPQFVSIPGTPVETEESEVEEEDQGENETTETPVTSLVCQWKGCTFQVEINPRQSAASEDESAEPARSPFNRAVDQLEAHLMETHVQAMAKAADADPAHADILTRCQWGAGNQADRSGCPHHDPSALRGRTSRTRLIQIVKHVKTHLPPRVAEEGGAVTERKNRPYTKQLPRRMLAYGGPLVTETGPTRAEDAVRRQVNMVHTTWGDVAPEDRAAQRRQTFVRLLRFIKAIAASPVTRPLLSIYRDIFINLNLEYPGMGLDMQSVLANLLPAASP